MLYTAYTTDGKHCYFAAIEPYLVLKRIALRLLEVLILKLRLLVITMPVLPMATDLLEKVGTLAFSPIGVGLDKVEVTRAPFLPFSCKVSLITISVRGTLPRLSYAEETVEINSVN